MALTLKALVLSNNLLRLAALLIAYFLWYSLSSMHTASYTCTVPVYVNLPSGTRTLQDAPQYATVTLTGLRKYLRNIDYTKLAIHINEHELKPGTNTIQLQAHHVGLPTPVHLVHYAPTNFTITVS